MPIQCNEENDVKVLVLYITGKLIREDYEHIVPELATLIAVYGIFMTPLGGVGQCSFGATPWHGSL